MVEPASPTAGVDIRRDYALNQGLKALQRGRALRKRHRAMTGRR